MKRGRYSETHRFFCIRCGNEGIPIPRRGGRLKATGHMKKLYCPHCKMEINHVELRTEADVMKFKEDFESGKYVEEARKSEEENRRNASMWLSGQREIYLRS